MMHRPCMEMHADIVIHDIMKHTPRGAHTHTEAHRCRNSPCTTTRLWVLKFNRTLRNNNRCSSLLKHLGLLGYLESVGIWQNTNRWTKLHTHIVRRCHRTVFLSFSHTRKWHVTLGCRCWDLVPLMQIQLADLMKSDGRGKRPGEIPCTLWQHRRK